MRLAANALGAATAVLLALSACGSASSGGTSNSNTSPTPLNRDRSCRALTFPFPPAQLELSARDSGSRHTIKTGALITVALLGQGRHWQPIQLQGNSLIRLPNGAQAATVGTQLGAFCAVSPGAATLTSRNEASTWNVEIEVQ